MNRVGKTMKGGKAFSVFVSSLYALVVILIFSSLWECSGINVTRRTSLLIEMIRTLAYLVPFWTACIAGIILVIKHPELNIKRTSEQKRSGYILGGILLSAIGIIYFMGWTGESGIGGILIAMGMTFIVQFYLSGLRKVWLFMGMGFIFYGLDGCLHSVVSSTLLDVVLSVLFGVMLLLAVKYGTAALRSQLLGNQGNIGKTKQSTKQNKKGLSFWTQMLLGGIAGIGAGLIFTGITYGGKELHRNVLLGFLLIIIAVLLAYIFKRKHRGT